MPSDGAAFDEGLLNPIAVGHDHLVSDRAVLRALVAVEAALTGVLADAGVLDAADADAVAAALEAAPLDLPALAAESVAGGNPVIPLVKALRAAVPQPLRRWVHRGATSQDIVDSALMLIASDALTQITADLGRVDAALARLAQAEAGTVAAARTLTQHAVPTTIGARVATWLRGVRRAERRLGELTLPAQFGGAGGTLAASVAEFGADTAERLPALLATRLGLDAPDAPWHVVRWPVTELGDALVHTIDALARIAADVATGSRTEIGELLEGTGGGSSAMPQKQNPAASVLLRSAGIRAPGLSATLHLASALAVDERPDGAWHAEWPALRELLRTALGAASHAAALAEGLRVDREAVARTLAATGGLIVSERLSAVLTPRIGAERMAALVADAGAGGDLAALILALPEAADLNVEDLVDPAHYLGLAERFATGHRVNDEGDVA